VEVEFLLLVFVGVASVAFILQCIFLTLALRSFKGLSDQVTRVSKGLERDTKELVAQFREVAASLENLSSISDKLMQRSDELADLFDRRSRDLDELAETFIRVGSKQAENIDQVVSSTVEKFEETTGIIQRDILQPVVEISSLIKGLKTAIDYLFTKNRNRSKSSDYSDESDLFI